MKCCTSEMSLMYLPTFFFLDIQCFFGTLFLEENEVKNAQIEKYSKNILRLRKDEETLVSDTAQNH